MIMLKLNKLINQLLEDQIQEYLMDGLLTTKEQQFLLTLISMLEALKYLLLIMEIIQIILI